MTCVFNHCDGPNDPEVPMLDVHYLLTNTREKNVDIERVTVIPMLFRTGKAQMRPRKTIATPSPKVTTVKLVPGYEKFTSIG